MTKPTTEQAIQELIDVMSNEPRLAPVLSTYLEPLREVLNAYQQLQDLGAQKPADYTDGDRPIPARLTWLSGEAVARVLVACATRDWAAALAACVYLKTELKEP